MRLGVARRDAGDAGAAPTRSRRRCARYGKDPEALRFLLAGGGQRAARAGALGEVWRQVTLDVDRRAPERPQVRVTWPGVPFGLCPCSGTPVDLDFQDGDLQDVFRLFADISGLNVVVQPGVQGRSPIAGNRCPGTRRSSRCSPRTASSPASTGTSSGSAGPRRPARSGCSRERHQLRLVGKDLVEALREIAAHGQAGVEVPEGVVGRVTLKLDRGALGPGLRPARPRERSDLDAHGQM